jgi:hypothetical protein
MMGYNDFSIHYRYTLKSIMLLVSQQEVTAMVGQVLSCFLTVY